MKEQSQPLTLLGYALARRGLIRPGRATPAPDRSAPALSPEPDKSPRTPLATRHGHPSHAQKP